jgi:hypothetical protein
MVPDGQPRGPEPALIIDPTPKRPSWHLMSPGPARERLMNPTDWRLKLDPGNVGLSEGWPEHGLPADAVPAEVPGVWNTMAPGYAGVVWYEATFRRPFLAGGAIRLVIGAANYQTDSWLNEVYLGRHEGGYDAFSFRCTHALRDGENRLTLRIVDPPPDGDIDGLRLRECPTAKESWYGGYGGPWGGVWFEQSAEIWIEDVCAYGDLPTGRASFRVTLASDLRVTQQTSVRAQIVVKAASTPDQKSNVVESVTAVEVHPTGAVTTLDVPITSPVPWSPERPTCYLWSVVLGFPGTVFSDSVVGTLGFRTCEWRDGIFYLNGERRFLKGALLQPTYPRTLVRAPGLTLREDIQLARKAGANLVRCHLRPPDPVTLALADMTGMMLYVEPPLAWIEPSGRLLEHGKRELQAMVRACGNHPCVVMWGIFNENARATEAVGGELMAELARLDPTRPIVENSGGAAVGETGMWAWGGQSRCWSPGWEAPRPLNDVHVYLANPLRREARDLMTTLGDGPTLDVAPCRPPNERIESRMSADAVLVSEYGCGALPDFDAALAAFGDEQHLADAALLRDLRDDLARGLEARGLDREIGDVGSLVRQTQALQAEGILAQTAALRRNPNVSGLILTQLADAGWEQMAGLVGYWRHPRPALEAFKQALQPRLLHVETDDPCGVDTVRVRAALIEEPGLPPLREPAALSLSFDGNPHSTGARPVRLPLSRAREMMSARRAALPRSPLDSGAPRPRVPLPVAKPIVAPRSGAGGEGVTPSSEALRGGVLMMPLPTGPGLYRVRARITTDGWQDEAACMARRLPDRPPETGAGVVLLGNGLRRSLPEAMLTLPPDWTGPILAYLPSRPTVASLKLAVERARAGAHLCLVGLDPTSAQQVERLIRIPLALHSGRGNFMGVHHYVRAHPVLAGIGAPCLADSTFAEVLPAWVTDELPGAEVLAGCFTVPDGGRGFLWRASLQTLPLGRGRLTLCQLQLGQRHGGALGGYLLDTLLAWLR